MEKETPRFRSKREQEREEVKNTLGYKVWVVMFALFYPFIAVFTFLFSGILMFFSLISRCFVYLLGKIFYARS
jgi:hypothetical protein